LTENGISTILIVDNNKKGISEFLPSLRQDDLYFITTTDPKEAMSIIGSTTVDVVLICSRLEEADGMTMGRSIMNRSPRTRVILFTEHPSFETAIEATKKGFFYFLAKSSPIEVIADKFREAVRSGIPSGAELSEKKQRNCLRFITICRHSMIIDQIKLISEENICMDYSCNFESIKEISKAGFQKETDLAMICASCTFTNVESSIQSIKELYTLFPFIKIIIFNENFADAEKARFLKLGIKGLFGSDMTSELLQKALLVIRDGGIWAERKILNMAIEPDAAQISRMLTHNEQSYGLSIREKEILRTLVLGIRNKDIAERLYISEKTVKTHVNRIFKKLGVDSRVKAILKAKEESLV